MKKILMAALFLMGSVALFSACEDDNDDNPTLIQPKKFVLNTPAYALEVTDLAHSTSIPLTWSQPKYTAENAPLVVTYVVQFSLTNQFTTSYAEQDADETGQTVADYVEYEGSFTKCAVDLDASLVATALQQLAAWPEGQELSATTVYTRVVATVSGRNAIASNVIALNILPYYVELSDAPIEIWYLIGGCIGDGSWGSTVGVSIFPLFPQADQEYDKKTGQGILSYTGWFPAGNGFKLKRDVDSWDYQWGAGDGGYVKNDGGSGNIEVAEDGYYTVKLDTKNDILTITKQDITPNVWTEMGMSGGFNDWGFQTMTAINAGLAENHIWYYNLDASSGAVEAKFLQDSNWSTNWGVEAFPYGVGTQNGPNIPVSAGNWHVFFNDIDGSFFFLAK